MPAAAPHRFSLNEISVLFNWQAEFQFLYFFFCILMKIAVARFQICISIDFYSNATNTSCTISLMLTYETRMTKASKRAHSTMVEIHWRKK